MRLFSTRANGLSVTVYLKEKEIPDLKALVDAIAAWGAKCLMSEGSPETRLELIQAWASELWSRNGVLAPDLTLEMMEHETSVQLAIESVLYAMQDAQLLNLLTCEEEWPLKTETVEDEPELNFMELTEGLVQYDPDLM